MPQIAATGLDAPLRRRVAALLFIPFVLVAGCTTPPVAKAPHEPGQTVSGTDLAERPGGSSDASSDGESCSDITHSDPWIAFAPSLSDGDQLEVGEHGWLGGEQGAADVELKGDVDAVEVSEQSAATEIACGEVRSTISWTQVDAIGTGTVTLTMDGRSLTITVVQPNGTTTPGIGLGYHSVGRSY